MSAQERGRIVVGVDGSEPSRKALAWAIRQAQLTGAVVDAVTAWEYPVSYGWIASEQDLRIGEAAAQTLADTIADIGATAPEVEIRPHVLEQNAARALLDASEGADLLVVGNRGHGGFVGALLGSVSQHCVHHAACPVVVMRGSPDQSPAQT